MRHVLPDEERSFCWVKWRHPLVAEGSHFYSAFLGQLCLKMPQGEARLKWGCQWTGSGPSCSSLSQNPGLRECIILSFDRNRLKQLSITGALGIKVLMMSSCRLLSWSVCLWLKVSKRFHKIKLYFSPLAAHCPIWYYLLSDKHPHMAWTTLFLLYCFTLISLETILICVNFSSTRFVQWLGLICLMKLSMQTEISLWSHGWRKRWVTGLYERTL